MEATRTDLARDGSWYGDGEKWLIVQARTIYSFCVAYEWFGEQVYLDEAAQGVAFSGSTCTTRRMVAGTIV